MKRNGEWFRRQLDRARAAIDEADRAHSPDEITAAEMALASPRSARQQSLFSVPPHAGLITDGQPEPTGLADHGHVGR